MKFPFKGQKRPRGFCRPFKDIVYFEGFLRHFERLPFEFIIAHIIA
jgi:hypothetical protein